MSQPIEVGFEEGLGDELSQLISSGEWQTRQSRVVEQIEQRKRFLQLAKEGFSKKVVKTFFGGNISGGTLSETQVDFFNYFTRMKEEALKREPKTGLGRIRQQAVEETGISDVHRTTEIRLDFFSREMGKQLIGSPGYMAAGKEADYWSRAEQVSMGAVEYGFRTGQI